jgi:hypothetical protein
MEVKYGEKTMLIRGLLFHLAHLLHNDVEAVKASEDEYIPLFDY